MDSRDPCRVDDDRAFVQERQLSAAEGYAVGYQGSVVYIAVVVEQPVVDSDELRVRSGQVGSCGRIGQLTGNRVGVRAMGRVEGIQFVGR